ncbi:MAG: hypothetical protein K8I27_12985 [Planctomycetes bacterium]|nr:hypothetical protein [Planctomycetota bacterium]
MRLEIGDARAFDDPGEDHVRRELELLALGRSDFVILARREMDYVQATKEGKEIIVEWQERGIDNHWQAVTDDAGKLSEFFLAYLRGDKSYKTLFDFEKLDL